VPNVEFKRKARLSRQEVADRLIALGNALASGSEIELSSGGDTLKLGVAGHVNWELEIEIDGDETELEIEIKWTDDPSRSAEPNAAPATDDQAPAPAAAGAAADPAPASEKPASARRGRPRKIAAT
jgi:amphi-Trp domain-containing protein